jgi:hypothetical protein
MNKHEGCVRGYYRSIKAWYAKANDYPMEITFGMFEKGDGTSGEMSVRWEELGGKIVPCFRCFDDGWSALSLFTDLIKKMGEVDNENISEADFAKMLDECGFEDLTPYQSPYGEPEMVQISIPKEQAFKLGLIK